MPPHTPDAQLAAALDALRMARRLIEDNAETIPSHDAKTLRDVYALLLAVSPAVAAALLTLEQDRFRVRRELSQIPPFVVKP